MWGEGFLEDHFRSPRRVTGEHVGGRPVHDGPEGAGGDRVFTDRIPGGTRAVLDPGTEGARQHEERPQAQGLDLLPQGLGEAVQGGLARGIEAVPGHTRRPVHGGDVDDRPAATTAHRGQHGPGECHGAEEVDLEDRAVIGLVLFLDGADDVDTRVVDEDVDAAGPLLGLPHGLGAPVTVRDVELKHEALVGVAVRQAGHRSDHRRRRDDPVALLQHMLGKRVTETAGRAADEPRRGGHDVLPPVGRDGRQVPGAAQVGTDGAACGERPSLRPEVDGISDVGHLTATALHRAQDLRMTRHTRPSRATKTQPTTPSRGSHHGVPARQWGPVGVHRGGA